VRLLNLGEDRLDLSAKPLTDAEKNLTAGTESLLWWSKLLSGAAALAVFLTAVGFWREDKLSKWLGTILIVAFEGASSMLKRAAKHPSE
jgi:hypothetical protein